MRYLERCKTVLRPGSGVIVIKENLSTSGADVFDATDSSVMREEAKFQSLFQKAGLRVVRTELQRGFPHTSSVTLPVRMYALKPSI